jgi:hypothetical protein
MLQRSDIGTELGLPYYGVLLFCIPAPTLHNSYKGFPEHYAPNSSRSDLVCVLCVPPRFHHLDPSGSVRHYAETHGFLWILASAPVAQPDRATVS